MVARPKLVVIVGETASGKSTWAMDIARQFDGEIIASDSRTVYRGMDIGTAKPSQEDQQEIRHHGLDLVDPGERFTAAQFKEFANSAISDISSRGKLPIMVGGTGLYNDAVMFDFSFSKDMDKDRREQLEAMTDQQLADLVDEAKGYEVNKKNRRHMIRFIETGGTAKNDKSLRDNTLVLGVSRSKNQIRERISKRVELMFRMGLRKEVDELISQYGWESEALTGIGYREFRQFYEDGVSMGKVKRDIVQASINYAKRQRTWFKRNPHINWLEPHADVIKIVGEFINN